MATDKTPAAKAPAPAAKATTQADTTAGAQPATGESTEGERESHEERITRLEALASGSEGNPGAVPDGKEFAPREEVLRLWRALEHVANQLNISLPQ